MSIAPGICLNCNQDYVNGQHAPGCALAPESIVPDLTALSEAASIHKLAVETDTALAPLWETEQRNRAYAYEVRQRLQDPRYGNRSQRTIDEYEQQIHTYQTRAAEARAEAAPLEAIYDTYRWSRFFLCTASNGHIHSTTACTTTFVTTQFAWLPELSGLTEAEAVEAHGEILCSVCFPSAPVAWTNGVAKAVQAERAEREAAKVERAAKKAAKALYPEDPDKGIKTPHDTLRTIAAAKMWLTDAMGWEQSYIKQGREGHHPSYPEDVVHTVADLVAERTESMAHLVLAAAAKRAQKRGY